MVEGAQGWSYLPRNVSIHKPIRNITNRRSQVPVVLILGQKASSSFLEVFLFSSQSVSGPEGPRFSFKGRPCQA
jgi:hypothetical protein